MKPITHIFKTLMTSWGVYITLTADAVPVEEANIATQLKDKLKIADNLWLDIQEQNFKLTNNERHFLVFGLKLVATRISSATDGLPTLIHILNIQFNECDYQEEGLACAVASWAAEYFKFSRPDFNISFDKTVNKYVFHFK